MPIRKEPLITDQVYHVFNKTIAEQTPLADDYYCNLFHSMLRYYRSDANPGSFSKFYRQEPEVKTSIMRKISNPHTFKVEIYSFCLMPNHYHFLLKQIKNNGISALMGDLVNSFTRHYNLKEDGLGPIFLPRFRATTIRSDSQFIHTARYIELNPFTSGVVQKIEELADYKWSSLKQYVTGEGDLCQTEEILNRFLHNPPEEYQRFVFDRADYQKSLSKLKREQLSL